MVMNFVDDNWQLWHVGLFKASDILGDTLAEKMKLLLYDFQLNDKVIAYMKDEGTKLSTLTTTFTSMMICNPFGMTTPYACTCFGQAMHEACQYSTTDEDVCGGMSEANIAKNQAYLQEMRNWTKNSDKWRQKWDCVCVGVELVSRELKTLMKTQFTFKVNLF